MQTFDYRVDREARRVASLTCPRCVQARTEAAELCKPFGGELSTVPDHWDDWCGAQSIQTLGPDYYGHPRVFVQVR